MTDDDWAVGFAKSLTCSSTAMRSPSPTRAASGPDARSCSCSTRASWTWRSPSRRSGTARSGPRCWTPRCRRARCRTAGGQAGRRAAHPEPVHAGPGPCLIRSGRGRPATGSSSARLRVRGRRRQHRLPGRAGRQPRLPVADPAGRPGIDARLRRGGPLPDIRRPGRRGRVPGHGAPVPPAGLGVIVDIVPNHMAIPVPEWLNRPFWSVLRDGPAAEFASWFDVDWAAQDGRLLLPVLGGPLEDCLDDLTVAGQTSRRPSRCCATLTTCSRSARAPPGCHWLTCWPCSTTGWPTGGWPPPS